MPIVIPPGVTRRSLATLASRGSPFGVSGKAVVCCVHGREKRQVTDLAVDVAREKPHLCPCCQNLYAKPSDEPGLCPTCRPGVRTP